MHISGNYKRKLTNTTIKGIFRLDMSGLVSILNYCYPKAYTGRRLFRFREGSAIIMLFVHTFNKEK